MTQAAKKFTARNLPALEKIAAEGSIIVLERVKVVREEVHPGTPEHTAILRDLYKRALG